MLAQATGASVLQVSVQLPGGTSTWTVSGSCRVSVSLVLTAAA
jgi:hypothetical protein